MRLTTSSSSKYTLSGTALQQFAGLSLILFKYLLNKACFIQIEVFCVFFPSIYQVLQRMHCFRSALIYDHRVYNISTW